MGLADRTRAIELDPKLPEAWCARGSAQYLLGNYEKAMPDLEQALKLNPNYQEARDVLDKAKTKFVEQTAAVPAAQPAEPAPPQPAVEAAAPKPSVEVKPVLSQPQAVPAPPPPKPQTSLSAEGWNEKGRALTKSNQYSEAIEALSEAIRLKPAYPAAYNGRGYARHLARQYKQAIADFDEAIRLNPKYVNAIRNRANSKRAAGDKAGSDADNALAAQLERQ